MTDQHPITPPQWQMDAWQARIETMGADVPSILLEVSQWGADQELEACCEWLACELRHEGQSLQWADDLRAALRPKPPSLKEQAWKLLECYGTSGVKLTADQCNTIREALEELPDD